MFGSLPFHQQLGKCRVIFDSSIARTDQKCDSIFTGWITRFPTLVNPFLDSFLHLWTKSLARINVIQANQNVQGSILHAPSGELNHRNCIVDISTILGSVLCKNKYSFAKSRKNSYLSCQSDRRPIVSRGGELDNSIWISACLLS